MNKKYKTNNTATKTDINKLVKSINILRSESKSTRRSLWREILRVEGKVEKVEDKVEKVKENLIQKMTEQHDQVMTAISNFAGRVETLETENSVGTDQTSELRVQVDNHEARITTLESI